MTIKEEIESLYKEKELIDNKIETLRSSCTHKNQSIVDYYWRIGSSMPAHVCDDCGERIKWVEDSINPPYTLTTTE